MVELIVELKNHRKSKYGDKLSRKLKIINQIRSDLEDIMYIEYPKDANIDIFYGERPDIRNLLKEYYNNEQNGKNK